MFLIFSAGIAGPGIALCAASGSFAPVTVLYGSPDGPRKSFGSLVFCNFIQSASKIKRKGQFDYLGREREKTRTAGCGKMLNVCSDSRGCSLFRPFVSLLIRLDIYR